MKIKYVDYDTGFWVKKDKEGNIHGYCNFFDALFGHKNNDLDFLIQKGFFEECEAFQNAVD